MVPYKWTRRPWENISHLWHDLTNGIANLVRWFPLVWRDRDWDWSYMAQMMEYKLNRMSDTFSKYGHHKNNKLDAKRCRICAILLRRLLDDEYYELAGGARAREDMAHLMEHGFDTEPCEDHPGHVEMVRRNEPIPREEARLYYKRARALQMNDQKYLGILLGKYLNHWWD